MDKRTEPATDDDSSDRSWSGAPVACRVRLEFLDPRGLLSGPESARVGELFGSLTRLLAREGLCGEGRVEAVGDGRMSDLHGRHRGEEGTTDVLTFDLSGDGRRLDTDIVVCVDEARRQCAARGHGVAEELVLYVVHGVLHCTGYDDAEDGGERGAVAMHRREDEILSSIGAGVVYATGPGEDRP